MPAPIFSRLPNIFVNVFGEAGDHYWLRHDAVDAVKIKLIFNPFYQEIDADGIAIEDARPAAFVNVADALSVAPERNNADPVLIFDNDDEIIVNSTAYLVESCKPDGYGMLKLLLMKKN